MEKCKSVYSTHARCYCAWYFSQVLKVCIDTVSNPLLMIGIGASVWSKCWLFLSHQSYWLFSTIMCPKPVIDTRNKMWYSTIASKTFLLKNLMLGLVIIITTETSTTTPGVSFLQSHVIFCLHLMTAVIFLTTMVKNGCEIGFSHMMTHKDNIA